MIQFDEHTSQMDWFNHELGHVKSVGYLRIMVFNAEKVAVVDTKPNKDLTSFGLIVFGDVYIFSRKNTNYQLLFLVRHGLPEHSRSLI